jgi:hypothetical protein
MIARKKNTKGYKRQGVCYLEKQRWVVERTISWLKRCFRRLTVRWERKEKYWKGLLTLGLSELLGEFFKQMDVLK